MSLIEIECEDIVLVCFITDRRQVLKKSYYIKEEMLDIISAKVVDQ